VDEIRRKRLLDVISREFLRAPQTIPPLVPRPLLLGVVRSEFAPRIVGRVVPARAGAVDDQPDGALGVCRREEDRHRSALGHAEHDRALGAGGVHDGAGVVHPNLERRQAILGHPVGQPDASLVEDQQSAERGEASKEAGEPRLRPHPLDMRDPAQDEEDVDRAVTDDLVRDMHAVRGLGVSRLVLGEHVDRERMPA
jgi:hypothetical protein